MFDLGMQQTFGIITMIVVDVNGINRNIFGSTTINFPTFWSLGSINFTAHCRRQAVPHVNVTALFRTECPGHWKALSARCVACSGTLCAPSIFLILENLPLSRINLDKNAQI